MDYRYFTSKKHINQIRNFLHRRCSETYSWDVWVQCQMPNALIFWKMFLV